jgi:hypothetical protein
MSESSMSSSEDQTRPFRWTTKSEEAAALLAADRLTNDQIAEQLGLHRATLARWKQHPEFMARIDELVEAFKKTVRRRGIAQLERRVDALNDRWQRMQQVIEERAADPTMGEVPGGKTGLVVRQLKGIGKGDDFKVVEMYAVDAGLLAEMRNTEKQAAQEMGQWTEKTQFLGDEDHPIPVKILNGVRMEEL